MNSLAINYWAGRGKQTDATWHPDAVRVVFASPEIAIALGAMIREKDDEGNVKVYVAEDWSWNGAYSHQLDGDAKPRRWRNHRWFRGASVRIP